MVSAVQVVFLIDINQFLKICSDSTQYTSYKSKICLCCLRLLTEFGALTDNGNDKVTWSFKFYNSEKFKPDTSRKVFVDFNKTSFDELSSEIEAAIKRIKDETTNSRKTSLRTRKGSFTKEETSINNGQSDISSAFGTGHSHSYILKKSLQEVLLDYNWDRPDISSPVKKKSRPSQRPTRNSLEISLPYLDSIEELNFVICFTKVPTNSNELSKFNGSSNNESRASQLIPSLFDESMLNGFQKEKKLRFHIVNIAESYIQPSFKQELQVAFNKLLGGVHEISNLVQEKDKIISDLEDLGPSRNPDDSLFLFKKRYQEGTLNYSNGSDLGMYSNHWWNKKKIPNRSRAAQIGPTLEWEDSEGINFIKIKLNVLSVHAR